MTFPALWAVRWPRCINEAGDIVGFYTGARGFPANRGASVAEITTVDAAADSSGKLRISRRDSRQDKGDNGFVTDGNIEVRTSLLLIRKL